MKIMITQENYEGWLMRYADGALTSDEQAEVERFLEAHPELRDELAEVASVRVAPVVASMPGKERLLHREPVAMWRHVAAAVALLLVAGGAVLLLGKSADSPMPIARTEVPTVRMFPADTETVEPAVDPECCPQPATYHPLKKHTVQPSANLTDAEEGEERKVEHEECDAVVAEEVAPEPVQPEEPALPPMRVAVGYVVTDARLAVNPLYEAFALK